MNRPIERLRLNTPKNTRLSIARYIRKIQLEDEEQIDFRKYKLILDFLKEYRAVFSFEKEAKLADRIEQIESYLDALKGLKLSDDLGNVIDINKRWSKLG